jgi:hypothetical protein
MSKGNALNWESRFPDHPRGTTRRKQADIVLGKTLCQVQKTSLVVDGEDGYSWARESI